MRRLKPSQKQLDFAHSLEIDVSGLNTRQLRHAIDVKLDERKQEDERRLDSAREVDMLSLAKHYTTLKKQSWRYHCGPCPMGCTAQTDGFVVDTHHNSWFCRGCDNKGTPIGFVMKYHKLTFWEAVAELVGERHEARPPRKKREPVKKEQVFLWNRDDWQAEAQTLVAQSQANLVSDSLLAQQACDYLNERAIWMGTAQEWGLGQALVRFKRKEGKGKEAKTVIEEANALIIPWQGPDGTIKAIQYRFVGKASRRFHSKYGGEKTIFGAHLLAPSPDKILFIVEGEFNAVSIRQEGHSVGLRLDAISIGGEGVSDERLESLVKLTKRYRGCAAWLDREIVALRVGNVLEDAMLLKSPDGQDANDLAKTGELAGCLSQLCARFAQSISPKSQPLKPALKANPPAYQGEWDESPSDGSKCEIFDGPPAPPPPDFDFDDGLLEATQIADALKTKQSLDLYLQYEGALMAKDVVAAIHKLSELRTLRDTMAEWQKLKEDRERTERWGKGHY